MKEFLTLEEAAEYLDLSKQTIYNLSSLGKIKKLKPNNGKVYFKKSDLDGYVIGTESKVVEEVV